MTSAMLRTVFAVLVLGLITAGLVAGCSAPAAGGLKVEGVYSRPAPAGGMGGGFVTVTNTGDTADRLIGARTPVAQAVELHETIDDNGVMKMRPVPGGFEVPAKGKLELKPGGKHLMFVGLNSPLVEGKEIELTLTFEKAGDITVKAPIHQ